MTKTKRLNERQSETLVGWLMAGPAVVLLLSFLIIPFLMAFALAFTNQRLISPNPTEFVGGRNFAQLLSLRTLTLDPVVDPSTGALKLDKDGNPSYPRIRDFTRKNPQYPELDGLQELKTFSLGGNRQLVLLAGDAVFVRSLFNTLYFVILSCRFKAGWPCCWR